MNSVTRPSVVILRRASGLALCVVAMLLECGVASAQTTLTWTGTGGNNLWTNTANWNPQFAPTNTGSTYNLIFSGTNQLSSVSNGISTINIGSIAFSNTTGGAAGVFVLTGTATPTTLNLNNSTVSTGSAVTAYSNQDGEQIFITLSVSGSNNFLAGSGHNLTLGGTQGGGLSGNGTIAFDINGTSTSTPFTYVSGTGNATNFTGNTFIKGGNVQAGARTGVLISSTNAFGTGGSITVSGSGQLFVRNSSLLTNAISISGTGMSGSALLGSSGSAGSISQVTGPITLAGDATIGMAAQTTDSTSQFYVGGTNAAASSTVNLNSNTLTFRPSKAISASTGLLIDVTSRITGTGGVVLNASNSTARLRLTGSNNYTGTTTINSGTLVVNNQYALTNGSAALVVNTNGLDLNGYTAYAGALSGSSTGVIQSNAATASRLITNTVTSSTYAGVIRDNPNDAGGTVGLTKDGSGSLTLTGANTYTGSTSVIGGRLFVNGSLGNTETTVQGGTLSGNGTIGGNVTVLSGGTIAPGATSDPSYGTLSITGNLNLMTGAVANMEISGTTAGLFDQIATTGTVGFGGDLNISMNYNGVVFGTQADPFSGSQWQLFASNTSAFSGDFLSILLSGSYGNAGFYEYGNSGEWHANTPSGEFAFFTSGPRAGILYAVPEPATLTLAASAIGMLGLAGWRRARKRDCAAV